MKRLVIILLLWTSCTTAFATDPADLTWTLEFGPRDAWRGAILELMESKKGIPSLAAASVLRRREVLSAKETLELVRAMGKVYLTRDPRVLAFLRLEALEGSTATADAALKGLLAARSPEAAPILAELFRARPERRKEIARRLTGIYRESKEEEAQNAGAAAYSPHRAARQAVAGRREPLFYDMFLVLSAEGDSRLRWFAADNLRYLADERADELLWALAVDTEPEVGMKALWSLGLRRDERACTVLFERGWAKEAEPQQGKKTGLKPELAEVGEVCAPTHLFAFFDICRIVPAEDRRRAEILVAGATGKKSTELLQDANFRRRVERYREDPDPFIRRQSAQLLKAADDERLRKTLEDRSWKGPLLLAALALIAGLLGLVLFLWGFRLLQLRRLLRGLAPTPVRAAAMGTMLLQGRLLPKDDSLLRHPFTEEDCLFFPGADHSQPGQRFYLEDDTGRILVDPRGAVLLSEDGVLEPGEEVQLLGLVSRLSPGPLGDVGEQVIGKPRPPRTLFGGIGHFLVQGVLGTWDRTGHGRAIFSDPRRCFWIWDDSDGSPLGSGREAARMVAIFLAAGLWMTVFAGAALALIDRDFSAALALWLQ